MGSGTSYLTSRDLSESRSLNEDNSILYHPDWSLHRCSRNASTPSCIGTGHAEKPLQHIRRSQRSVGAIPLHPSLLPNRHPSGSKKPPALQRHEQSLFRPWSFLAFLDALCPLLTYPSSRGLSPRQECHGNSEHRGSRPSRAQCAFSSSKLVSGSSLVDKQAGDRGQVPTQHSGKGKRAGGTWNESGLGRAGGGLWGCCAGLQRAGGCRGLQGAGGLWGVGCTGLWGAMQG